MVAVREVWVYSGTHSHYSGSTSDPMSIVVIRNDGNGEIVAIWCRSRKCAVMQERCFGRCSHSYVALSRDGVVCEVALCLLPTANSQPYWLPDTI